jgi:hypothetical protein
LRILFGLPPLGAEVFGPVTDLDPLTPLSTNFDRNY